MIGEQIKMKKNYDFSGWATRNNLKCADGRTIRKDAFKDNDGQTVPLVWQHLHDDIGNVLGHAVLENREEGVYAYCYLNDSSAGKNARESVRHGDVNALSIYANKLQQNGGDVLHGSIKEVSLVLSGANPGAMIDSVVLSHSGDIVEDEAVIYTDEEITLSHAEPEKKDEPGPGPEKEEGKTVGEILDGMTEEQKNVMYFIIDKTVNDILKEKNGEDEEDETNSNNEGENTEMKHNVFDADNNSTANYISHSDMVTILSDAKRLGSLRESVSAHLEDGVLAHAQNADGTTQTYGMTDIDYLFPDARMINNTPEFIKRDQDWVAKVMNGTHHTPFSRVKSVFANITEDEARAKGYIKGKLKKEEVFTLLKRTTSPQTIYKKQKLDRDDVTDIVDFDVVSWIRAEMRMMLDEELARAILIGDGRNTSDDDHISEDHIRPIWKDAALYTIHSEVTGANAAEKAKNMIAQAIRARKSYKGSGNPALYCSEDILTEMLLLEDTQGRRLYDNIATLATAMRVSEIVTVPPMENLKDKNNKPLMGIIVNLNDYNVGADKGGEVNMFDDFDIDYNQQKYLIETRCSGALVKPYSAIVLEGSASA